MIKAGVFCNIWSIVLKVAFFKKSPYLSCLYSSIFLIFQKGGLWEIIWSHFQLSLHKVAPTWILRSVCLLKSFNLDSNIVFSDENWARMLLVPTLKIFQIRLVGGIFKRKERKKEWKWCKIICSVLGNVVFFWGLWIFFCISKCQIFIFKIWFQVQKMSDLGRAIF